MKKLSRDSGVGLWVRPTFWITTANPVRNVAGEFFIGQYGRLLKLITPSGYCRALKGGLLSIFFNLQHFHMKTPFRNLLFILSSFIVMTSCKSSKILSATFESDAVNQPPAKNPAGNPPGDVIQYVNELKPQLRVQNSTTASEKAMHLMNAPANVTVHNRWINFRGINTDLVQTLWFTFTAKNTNPAGNVMIDISDGANSLIARMRIHSNGEVRLAKTMADDYTDLIGNVGQNSHTVIFTA
ncbi:MAG TPA: hypothetical protein VK618_05755, partial [Flavitalea sp.]|nr:hypothetical protein [Flavitalea sp.]